MGRGRFILSLMILATLLGMAFAQGNVVEKKYAVVLKDANVRVMPTAKSQVLFTARAGQRFELLEDLGTWVKIKTPSGLVGYIWAKLVRVEVEKIVETPHPAQASQPSQPSQIKPAQGPPSGTQTVVSKKRSLLPLYIAGGAAVAGAAAYILFRKGGLLNKGTATLHISSSPSEAKVYIDGQEKCETPCTVEKVEPGTHTIKVERELYGKWEQEMELKGHEEYNIEATLSPYKYEADFCFGGYGSGDGKFNEPWDVTLDSNGNIYVADTMNRRLQKFDPSGNFLTKHTASSSIYPSGIVYSPYNSRVYVVFELDPARALNWYNLSLNWLGNKGLGLTHPRSLGVDSEGNIYIADAGADRIVKTDPHGNEITHWNTELNSWPIDAAPAPSGDVYVSLAHKNKIKIYSSSGVYKKDFPKTLNGPDGITVDKMGHVYVATYSECKVYKFTPDGEEILHFGSPGSGNKNFNGPAGIAVNENGDLFIADIYNHRICIWRLSDETLSTASAKITTKRKKNSSVVNPHRRGSFTGKLKGGRPNMPKRIRK